MVNAQYTPLQLAQRFIDQREIQNVMGKYALLTMICRQADLVKNFWAAQAPNPTLAKNNGWYVGLDAISGYYEGISHQIAVTSKLLKQQYPAQLGAKSDEEIFGAGAHFPRPLTTPLVEVAGDGKTAKGLWQVMGADNNVGACGPLSTWNWGYMAADFVLEQGEWKIWHLQEFDELTAPVASNWVKPAQLPVLAEYAALTELSLPAPTVAAKLYEAYTPTRAYTAPPRMPEAYDTFADTFSYGME